MKRFPLIAALLIAALGALATGSAQTVGLERLCILNGGGLLLDSRVVIGQVSLNRLFSQAFPEGRA